MRDAATNSVAQVPSERLNPAKATLAGSGNSAIILLDEDQCGSRILKSLIHYTHSIQAGGNRSTKKQFKLLSIFNGSNIDVSERCLLFQAIRTIPDCRL